MRNLQEHLGYIQLQGGNNEILELLMKVSGKLITKKFPSLWFRNSYYFKAHHPLVSDIDLTYIGILFEAKGIHQYAKKNKLMGELNFYPHSILQPLLRLANPFELKRDPILLQRYKVPKSTLVQKQVFLLRHIIGDIYWLRRNPLIRQKKWEYILAIAEEQMPTLNLTNLKALLFSSVPLDFYLSCREDDLFNEFKGSTYRCFFPHKYIWEEWDNEYLLGLSPFEKDFLIEQVKWEFWGVGTQLHWIDLKISFEFLERLKNVVIHIGACGPDIQDMNKILEFIQEQLQANRKSF